jgi:hypothetical protein
MISMKDRMNKLNSIVSLVLKQVCQTKEKFSEVTEFDDSIITLKNIVASIINELP